MLWVLIQNETVFFFFLVALVEFFACLFQTFHSTLNVNRRVFMSDLSNYLGLSVYSKLIIHCVNLLIIGRNLYLL